MRQMAGNLFGQDPEPPGLHDGPYRGACPLNNRFPVEYLFIGDNVTMLCRSHRTLLGSYTDALQGFLHNRMSAAIEEPNAPLTCCRKRERRRRQSGAVVCSARHSA